MEPQPLNWSMMHPDKETIESFKIEIESAVAWLKQELIENLGYEMGVNEETNEGMLDEELGDAIDKAFGLKQGGKQ